MRGMRVMHGPTMSQFLKGLSEGRMWAWMLTATLALIAVAILVRECDERKTRREARVRDSDVPEARRWLNRLKAKAEQVDRRRD